MKVTDKQIIALTVTDANTLGCPLCSYTVDVPPVPVSDPLAELFGMSGMTLARVHAEQVSKQAANNMRHHLDGHPGSEWALVTRHRNPDKTPPPEILAASLATLEMEQAL